MSAERNAAMRMAVPAADMKLKAYLAASLIGSWSARAFSSGLSWSLASAGAGAGAAFAGVGVPAAVTAAAVVNSFAILTISSFFFARALNALRRSSVRTAP